ncbi:MAG: DUF6893 family small protein [Pyrinomonadaceae bacterium]
MEREELSKQRDFGMKRESRRNDSSGHTMLGIAGLMALVGVAALVVVTLPDIKRYIKISTM